MREIMEEIACWLDHELLSDIFESARCPFYSGKTQWDSAVMAELRMRGYR